MTRKEFEHQMKLVAKDVTADNEGCPDFSIADCAYDLAENMLYDPEIVAFIKKEYKVTDKRIIKEIIADHICS